MKLSDFDFNLPEELIAQEPVSPRDHSRLLVLDKKTGEIIHKKFFEIIDFLTPNDVLVFNNTKVFPARLFGNKPTGGKIEVLLISPENKNIPIFEWPETWITIGSPKPKVGQMIDFSDELQAEVVSSLENNLEFKIKFNFSGAELKSKIYSSGNLPLPPYIKNPTEKSFKEYQTVYAKNEGSVAAPTAGFHFTNELIQKIKDKGIQIEFVSLNVGLGTFQPVKAEKIEEHKMHSEWFEISKETVERLNTAKENGKRIIAVGTTSCRVLESAAIEKGKLEAKKEETDIFIYPGYEFKFVDSLITNFHLPKSTLLMLISAFAGKENIFKAYEEAIKLKYRFYSFGDAMFI